MVSVRRVLQLLLLAIIVGVPMGGAAAVAPTVGNDCCIASRGGGKGLTSPKKYFGSKTKKQVEEALEKKFGPPKSTREHAKTYYNPQTKRSFNVHQEPGHQGGKPHVDIRRRGDYPERKFDLLEE